MIGAPEFREAMSRLGAAVHVITTDGPAGRHGMTVSAVCSVTDAPPTVLMCVNQSVSGHDLLKVNGVACVNILSAELEAMSRAFADRSVSIDARFAGHADAWRRTGNGCWAHRRALASLACTIIDVREIGSHSLFILRATELSLGQEAPGLVYFDRTYHHVPHAAAG